MSEGEKEHGIQFPQDANGRRSSIATGKQILAAAVEPIDSAVAAELLAETKWRDHYPHHIYNQVLLGLKTPENGLEIARNGLNALYDQFEFVRPEGKFSLREALSTSVGTPLHTATIVGAGHAPPERLTIPYQGEQLVGQQLLAQLGQWDQQAGGRTCPRSRRNQPVGANFADNAARPSWPVMSWGLVRAWVFV